LHERTDPAIANLTAGDVTNWILEWTPDSYQKMVASNYSLGLERDEKQLQANNYDFRKWANPLEIQWVIQGTEKGGTPNTRLQVTQGSFTEDFLHLWARVGN